MCISLHTYSLDKLLSFAPVVPAFLVFFAFFLVSPSARGSVTEGLTDDFKAWLAANGYANDDFARPDLTGGSFGGRSALAQSVTREPVIFVHGGSDRALGGIAGGWQAVLPAYVTAGYKASELYGTTYGNGTPEEVLFLTNSPERIDFIARFIKAVRAYTGKEKVNIVAHSFGVTLTRGALLSHDLGKHVRTFIAIAGTNLGAPGCYNLAYTGTPLCNLKDGVSPFSQYIAFINSQVGYEGQYRYSIWSMTDEIIGNGCAIAPWVFTCPLPGQTSQLFLNGWSHLALRDYTGPWQVQLIQSASL